LIRRLRFALLTSSVSFCILVLQSAGDFVESTALPSPTFSISTFQYNGTAVTRHGRGIYRKTPLGAVSLATGLMAGFVLDESCAGVIHPTSARVLFAEPDEGCQFSPSCAK
jgi:hypothetical protein